MYIQMRMSVFIAGNQLLEFYFTLSLSTLDWSIGQRGAILQQKPVVINTAKDQQLTNRHI